MGYQKQRVFVMSAEDAYELLESVAMISGSQDKLAKVKASATGVSNQNVKRPAVNFIKCNIPIGSELVYIDDSTIKAIVVDEHKVLYNDELTSLSAIAKGIKGYSVSGPTMFTYKGKLVTQIAEETQWKE